MRNAHDSIYLDPNQNPEFCYPLLKPLSFVYDRIHLWTPIGEQLKTHGFPLDEFVAACDDGAIIPTARERNFASDHAEIVDPDRDFSRELAKRGNLFGIPGTEFRGHNT